MNYSKTCFGRPPVQ